jgi:hypothetical protein
LLKDFLWWGSDKVTDATETAAPATAEAAATDCSPETAAETAAPATEENKKQF